MAKPTDEEIPRAYHDLRGCGLGDACPWDERLTKAGKDHRAGWMTKLEPLRRLFELMK